MSLLADIIVIEVQVIAPSCLVKRQCVVARSACRFHWLYHNRSHNQCVDVWQWQKNIYQNEKLLINSTIKTLSIHELLDRIIYYTVCMISYDRMTNTLKPLSCQHPSETQFWDSSFRKNWKHIPCRVCHKPPLIKYLDKKEVLEQQKRQIS